MFFRIHDLRRFPKKPSASEPSCMLLVKDSWDDFGFKTSFNALLHVKGQSEFVELGRVKIGRKGMKPARIDNNETGSFHAIAAIFALWPPFYCCCGKANKAR